MKEVSIMATSSIFSNINVNDEESCRRVIDAMESAVKATPKKVTLRHPVEEMNDEDIEELFTEA
jgi:nitrogen fixation protein FixH